MRILGLLLWISLPTMAFFAPLAIGGSRFRATPDPLGLGLAALAGLVGAVAVAVGWQSGVPTGRGVQGITLAASLQAAAAYSSYRLGYAFADRQGQLFVIALILAVPVGALWLFGWIGVAELTWCRPDQYECPF